MGTDVQAQCQAGLCASIDRVARPCPHSLLIGFDVHQQEPIAPAVASMSCEENERERAEPLLSSTAFGSRLGSDKYLGVS